MMCEYAGLHQAPAGPSKLHTANRGTDDAVNVQGAPAPHCVEEEQHVAFPSLCPCSRERSSQFDSMALSPSL